MGLCSFLDCWISMQVFLPESSHRTFLLSDPFLFLFFRCPASRFSSFDAPRRIALPSSHLSFSKFSYAPGCVLLSGVVASYHPRFFACAFPFSPTHHYTYPRQYSRVSTPIYERVRSRNHNSCLFRKHLLSSLDFYNRNNPACY